MEEMLTCTDPTFWKSGRIKTYTHWPFDKQDVCNAEKMAEAGFIAIGGEKEPDLVECFICGKQLDGWESDDDPWLEHASHEPSCEFVKLNKLDERTWTLKEFITLLKENKRIFFKKKMDAAIQQANKENMIVLEKIKKKF